MLNFAGFFAGYFWTECNFAGIAHTLRWGMLGMLGMSDEKIGDVEKVFYIQNSD